MKYILLISLLLPIGLMAQPPIPDTVDDYISGGEYFGLIYKASTHKAWHFLNVVPAACTGGPSYVKFVSGGPHDAFAVGLAGDLWGTGLNSGGELGLGNQTATTSGNLVQVTADSAGNPLDSVTQVLNTGISTGTFWATAIVTSTGKVGLAGDLQGGLRGDNTSGLAVNTKFVWVNFPGGAFIKKVTGLYGLLALDTTAGGRVWSWGFNNNKAQLGRGTSPSPDYRTPGLIALPSGWHAIDITDAGAYGVIVCDSAGNRKVLGIGDHPTFWGGASATSSNSPQDFTSFFTAQLASQTNYTVTPLSLPDRVYSNDGSIYHILKDSTMFSMGDNICGTIGNGQMGDWPNYTFAPAPTGGTPAPYAYDNGYGPTGIGELPQQTLYHIAPGTHNWYTMYCSPSNAWFAHALNNKGQIYGWGRDKAGQLVDSIASCNYVAGGQNGTYPDVNDNGWPHLILPFGFSSATQVNCPLCWTTPGATNCSQCSQTQPSAPTANAGPDQILTGGVNSAIMAAVLQSGRKFSRVVASVISSPPAAPTPLVPFPSSLTTQIYNLVPGVYTVQYTFTDQFSLQNTSTMKIYVNSYIKTPAIKKRVYRQL